MNRISRVCIILAIAATRGWAAEGMTPQQRGLAIAKEADQQRSGYGDNTARLRMILKNKQGQTSERQIRIRTFEAPAGGTKSLCIFDEPADVRGTILLTHTHPDSDDDQWLFLPALSRVRRIAAQNKSGSFMSSEFSYEDIAADEIAKYAYRWLRDEVYDGNDCYVIERRPANPKNSGYLREIIWIGKEHYRTWRVDYYDRKDALLKTLVFSRYALYDEKYWRASEMEMINHQTGKSTRLIWSDFAFGTGLTDADFDRQVLAILR